MSNDLLRRAFKYLKNHNDEVVGHDTWQSHGLSDLLTEIENHLGKTYDFEADINFPSGYILDQDYISINSRFEIAVGYDTQLYGFHILQDAYNKILAESYDQHIIPADRKYLADYMIALWNAYREKVDEE